MSKSSRKSLRIQNQQESATSATLDSPRPKQSKLKKVQENHRLFDYDHLQKELDEIEQVQEKPTGEFYNEENDIDGTQLFPVGTPPKTDNKKSPISKIPKIHLERLKNPSSSIHHNKENKGMKNKHDPKEQINLSPRRTRSGRKVQLDYIFEAETYFDKHSEKCKTSDHTLSRLKNRNLDEGKIKEILRNNNHIPKEHKIIMNQLLEVHESKYVQWIHVMKEGFNILLYGLGSKRLLINKFFKTMIPDEPTLIVNGFFPSLTLKEILDDIIVQLLGLEVPSGTKECFDLIEKTMKTHKNDCIYLLIHNIDGGMLRSTKTQDILSRLASIPNIHLVASVDHINAPLIWDNVKRERYNFYWIDAITLLPYEVETSYEDSLLVKNRGELALLSLHNVFASLTTNAKGIYMILVKYQLENEGKYYSGMAFKDLYRASREKFLVSTDSALRAQLTEFTDHKLVKNKRNCDGVESLSIPLDSSLLRQFREEYEGGAD